MSGLISALLLVVPQLSFAALLPLNLNFDTIAADIPADTNTNAAGSYFLQDDWAGSGSTASFVLTDQVAAPITTVTATGNATMLDTSALGLGVDDAILDTGEAIEFAFDVAVYLQSITTNSFSGVDAIFWEVDSEGLAGFESGLFSDDGDLSMNVLVPANTPLRVGSLNGSFSLAGLSVATVPEPSWVVMLLGVFALAYPRSRRPS